jgi:hypothetical protein
MTSNGVVRKADLYASYNRIPSKVTTIAKSVDDRLPNKEDTWQLSDLPLSTGHQFGGGMQS